MIISIQSQVVHGHVGNSAALLPMQAHGIAVAAVPTTLLSNHPHYPTMRGRVLEVELVADLLRGVEERGLVESARCLVTGYLGSVENGKAVADFVARAKARNPDLTYVCDPVIGDEDLGIFVADGLPQLIRDRLVPHADVMTPNQFEFGLLAGQPLRSSEALRQAAARLRGRIAVTGCMLADTPPDHVETIAIVGAAAWRVTTPCLPVRPAGTGDLFTGLLAAGLAKGAAFPDAVAGAVSSTYDVLEITAATGSREMCLVEALANLTRPTRLFPPVAFASGTAEA